MEIGKYYEKKFKTYKPQKQDIKKPHPPKLDVKESMRAVMRGRGGRHGQT